MGRIEQPAGAATTPARKLKIKWFVGVILLLLIALMVMNLPRGYSDDLSRIGKGQAAVVLVHNKNSVSSLNLMHVLDEVRGKYAGQVEFLLTDANTPTGQAFINTNQAAPASLVLFNANGNRVKILPAPQTVEGLRQEIAGAFGAMP